MKFTLPLFAGLLLANQAIANSESTDSARLIESIESAKPIKRAHPEYPRSEAQKGREGWTQLSFVIGTEGKPYDIEVINSSGNNKIDKAARLAVKKWRYSPATADGEAIEQCQTQVQMDFRIGNTKGVSQRFYRRLKVALKHLRTEDVEQIKKSIDELDDIAKQRLEDFAWLSYIKANYYRLTGESDKELYHLSRTIPYAHKNSKESILPEETVLYSLQQLFILQAQKSLYQDAMQTFRKIQQFDSDQATKTAHSLAPYNERIEKAIHGDKMISVAANISSNESWNHNLARNKFSITNIQGDLHKLDVRCDNKRHIYTVNDATEWTIPPSWGHCQVLVEGDKGSKFTLVELPQKS